jgi:hypothetical protein
LENSEEILYVLLISHLPTLPTGRQAQAGISKEDDTDFADFLTYFLSVIGI